MSGNAIKTHIAGSWETLRDLAERYYGTGDAVDCLHRANPHVKDPMHLKDGDKIKLPGHLCRYVRLFSEQTGKKAKDKGQKRKNGKKNGKSGVKHGVFTQLHPRRFPITFFYLDRNKKKKLAARRFVYCWKKDKQSGGWKNVGILITDDWGCAYHHQAIIERNRGTVEIATKQIGPKTKNHFTPMPFGFYDATVTDRMRFPVPTPQRQKSLRLRQGLSSPHLPFLVRPGEEVAFVFAPLDTIRGQDHPLPSQDRFGVESRPEHVSAAHASPPSYARSKDPGQPINSLIYQGSLKELKLPQPRAIKISDGKGVSTFESIHVVLELNLAEAVSQLAQAACRIDRLLQVDLRNREHHRKMAAQLETLDEMLNLMARHPAQHFTPSYSYTEEERKEIDRYRGKLRRMREAVEQAASRPKVSTSLHTDRNKKIDPKVKKQLALSVPKLKKSFVSLLKDRALHEELIRYLEQIRDHRFTNPTEDYFSFRKPVATIMYALQNAFLAFSYLPDDQLVRELWKEVVRPLELQCIQEFDGWSPSHPVKKATLEMVGDIYSILRNPRAAAQIKAQLLRPSAMARREAGQGQDTVLVQIWKVISHPRATGFWNNQAGAESAMTRILTAYARYRNSQIIKKLQATAVDGLKIAMVHSAALTRGMLPINRVTNKHLRLTLERTSRARELIKQQQAHPKYDPDELSRAHPIVSTLASGIQLVVAVYGIYEIIGKRNPGERDFVQLVDSVSNAGLALSGLPKAALERMLVKEAVRQGAGHALTIVTYISQAYYASLDATDHLRYGDRFLCSLSFLKVALSIAGALRHLVLAFAGCSTGGPVGWVIFVGLIVVELAIHVAKEARPGTQNVLGDLIRQMDQNRTVTHGGRHTAAYREIYDHRPVIYLERRFVPNEDPDKKMCLEGGKEVTVHDHPKLRDRSYLQQVQYQFSRLPAHQLKEWEDKIIKQWITMKPLDLSTLPFFVSAGWSLQNLKKLFHPGGPVAVLSQGRVAQLEQEVVKHYYLWQTRRASRPDLVVQRRAELLMGN